MKSIRWKITVSYFLLAAITLALTGTLLVVTTRFFAGQAESDSLRETAEDLVPGMQDMLRSEIDPARIGSFIQLAESLGNVDLRFIGPDGEVDVITLFTERLPHESDVGPGMPRRRTPTYPDLSQVVDRLTHEDAGRILGTTMRHGPDGSIRLGLGNGAPESYLEISDRTELSERLTRLTAVGFLISAIVTLGASTLIGLAVGSNISRPIVQLTRTVETMHRGDIDARALVTSRDEIGTLANRFNGMADELSNTIRSLRNERDSLQSFLADASHELRTPLTAMSTFVELLLRGDVDADQSELLEELESQTRRMGHTVSDLLLLSRLDGEVSELERSWQPITAVLQEAWDHVSPTTAGRGPEFSVTESTGGGSIFLDRKRVVTLFENLFQNSINAIGDAGKLTCTISVEGSDCVVRIVDDGPGIAADDLSRVFDRFFRSRSAGPEGSGLGLPIAQSVAKAHGGMITARSPVTDDGRGTEMTVTLPAQVDQRGNQS